MFYLFIYLLKKKKTTKKSFVAKNSHSKLSKNFLTYSLGCTLFHVFVAHDDLGLNYWYMRYEHFFTYLLRMMILVFTIGI